MSPSIFTTRWPVHSHGILITDPLGESVIKLTELDFGLGSSTQTDDQEICYHEFVLEIMDLERRLIRCDLVKVELRLEPIESRTSPPPRVQTTTSKQACLRWRPHVKPNK